MKDGNDPLLPAIDPDIYSLNTAVRACCLGGIPLKGLEVRSGESGVERSDELTRSRAPEK